MGSSSLLSSECGIRGETHQNGAPSQNFPPRSEPKLPANRLPRVKHSRVFPRVHRAIHDLRESPGMRTRGSRFNNAITVPLLVDHATAICCRSSAPTRCFLSINVFFRPGLAYIVHFIEIPIVGPSTGRRTEPDRLFKNKAPCGNAGSKKIQVDTSRWARLEAACPFVAPDHQHSPVRSSTLRPTCGAPGPLRSRHRVSRGEITANSVLECPSGRRRPILAAAERPRRPIRPSPFGLGPRIRAVFEVRPPIHHRELFLSPQRCR